MSARLNSDAFGTGCCLVWTGAAEGPADNTLESWLGTREKAPAPLPQADAAPTRTTVIQNGGEVETDWRLIPFIAAQASGGVPGQPTLLSIAVTSPYGQPNPQHEAITYVLIDDLPPGTTLSSGDKIADDTWRVRLEELPGLTMTLPPETADSVTLHLTAVTDHGGGVIAKQARDLTIAILPAATETAAADSAATPEPGGTQPPAQGGSSQSIEAAALDGRTEPDRVADPVASGQSAPQAAPEPTEGEASAPAPAPVPGPVADAPPEPPPEQTVEAAIEPTSAPSPEVTAEPPVAAAAPPPVDAPAAVQPAAASPSSPPAPSEPVVTAPVATVAVAALPPAAAPPPAPERAQPREAAVQRPARLPSAVAETTLMKRGDDLFAQGDLAGARLYYEMVAETGNAAAALALGRTHDPLVHERLRVRGLPSDPEQAAAWYRRAVVAGSGDAEQQLQKLTVWLAGKSR
ncbi:hypothetical protein F1643_03330 [Azospirillum sp. INR13]|uniref:hypothetical protein n=1 Tax=Azospirillum sp. INR13 TaxID=2596919 RepID=UPI00189286C4|nr:hypothetical protein [Azospirillum sp. INR13]MBF5093678.1 hypothetical protein [Azospirillum sp. INR13]